MTDLERHVAAAVRPVRAAPGRKQRMRRELLAHLTAIYDAERAALGDDGLASARAVRRFGDPATLTRELQATVPRVERWLFAEPTGPFDQRLLDFETACRDTLLLVTDPGGFSWRTAFGASARWAAVLLVAGLLFGVVSGALRALALGVESVRPTDGLAVGVGFCAYVFVATPLALGLVGALVEGFRRRAAVRAAGFAAALLLAGLAFVSLLGAARPDNPLWAYLVETPERRLTAAGVFAGWVLLVPAALRISWVLARRRAALAV